MQKFNVPGRLDTVLSAHSRSLAFVRFLPLKLSEKNTHAIMRHYAKCPHAPGL